MEFLKYGSLRLVRSENDRIIQEIKESELSKEQWMVTEKIHGSNAGIYFNSESIKVASRVGFLESFSKFHGFQDYVLQYKEGLKGLDQVIRNGVECNFEDTLETLDPYTIIFGEYFGGSIQKGMPYPTEKQFRAFDVVTVINKTDQVMEELKSEPSCYLEHPSLEGKIILYPFNKLDMLEHVKSFTGIDTVKPIFVGSIDGCLLVDKERKTDYACNLRITESGMASKGSEALQHYVTSEGIVIEPVETKFHNGEKLALKRKAEKFKEKEQVDRDVVPLHERNKLALFEYEHDFLSELDSMVTRNRYDAVVSKFGEVGIKDFPKILKEFMADIQKDGEEFLEETATADVCEDRFFGYTKIKQFDHPNEMMMLLTNTVKSFIRPLLLTED